MLPWSQTLALHFGYFKFLEKLKSGVMILCALFFLDFAPGFLSHLGSKNSSVKSLVKLDIPSMTLMLKT